MFREKLGLIAQKIIAIEKYFLYFAIIILSVAAGFIVGVKYDHRSMVNLYLNNISPVRESDLSYKFIRPLLTYNIPSAGDESELRMLKNNIIKLVENQKNNKKLTDFSLFVSELDKGRWIGVNETQKYTAASLWKVAIMMAYLKKAQQDDKILGQNLVYTKAMDELTIQTKFDAPTELEIDKSYKVDDLINMMIIDSDNGAKTLLLANINEISLVALFNDLTVPNPLTNDYVISPLNYSLFFRVLYNGSYLNHKMSEKALLILSQAKFMDGLAAGLPANTTVAHKFGENVVANGDRIASVELHDCGIVYYKPSPYFICVMTKGPNLDDLKSTIKDVSSLVYQKLSGLK
jgi:beta-lactamase class A